MCTTKLRRLHLIEDARFFRAREDEVRNKLARYPSSSALNLEQVEAGALPSLALLETLSRYQTTLDRQLSKAIGELMVLKANEIAQLKLAQLHPVTLS